MKNSTKFALVIFLIGVIFICVILKNNKKPDIEETQQITENKVQPVQVDHSINIPLNDLECYNFKTKEEIYNIRKKHVASSIFANPNYQPSEEVFGQIISNKPWRSLEVEACLPPGDITDEDRIRGISEESRYINNPHILIGAEKGFVFTSNIHDFCKSPLRYFLPYRTTYDNITNTIIGYYKINPDYAPESFNGKNARDLGYQYAFAYKYKGLHFTEQTNIATAPYKFRDFIHLGGSCGAEGGCNNGSPHQPDLSFKIDSFPASVTFKLWGNDTNKKPDIYYQMIFEEAET